MSALRKIESIEGCFAMALSSPGTVGRGTRYLKALSCIMKTRKPRPFAPKLESPTARALNRGLLKTSVPNCGSVGILRLQLARDGHSGNSGGRRGHLGVRLGFSVGWGSGL